MELESRINDTPDFWQTPEKAAPVLKEKKQIETTIDLAEKLQATLSDLDAAAEFAAAGHDEYLTEAVTLVEALEESFRKVEVQKLLGGELDSNDAIVQINAGAGGTESCDWAAMLFRMYLRYAERKSWTTEIFDMLDGEGAGIKNVSFQVSGTFAFGLLKAESGVHRLVRISPFDSNARRHTSFASVFISPVIDDTIHIDINPADLRVDTYRASGAGGQHVNRTDSAVRITHNPTGIVVQCQSQRSQHQNRDQAMKMLKSKLYEREMDERRKKQEALENTKSDIGWGSQIRSYVLHPYKMVKDHRTGEVSQQPQAVLDGDLDAFINSFLSFLADPTQKRQSSGSDDLDL